MAYPQERRTQVFTSPRFDNRLYRRGSIKGYSQNQNLNPRLLGYDAAAMLEDEIGIKADSQGNWGSTRNYGRDMLLGSQQRNSLSRGTKGGYASNLRTPLNSNLTPRGFADSVAQRNQSLTPGAPVMTREQRIAQAQQDGTFGTIRDKFNIDNEGAGLSMNKFGNIRKMTEPQKAAPSATGNRPVDNALIEKRGFDSPVEKEPAMGSRLSDMMGDMGRRSGSAEPAIGQRSVTTPAPTGTSAPTPQMSSQQLSNRKALEDRAAGLRLLREMSQTPLQKGVSAGSYGVTVEGQYGEGNNVPYPKGEKRSVGYEGSVNGRPFSEVMQGLATKQVREGTWREGDALPYEDQNSGLNPNKIRRSVKDVTEENRQKILSRQRLAAKNR